MSEQHNLPLENQQSLLKALQHGACGFFRFEELAQGRQEIIVEYRGQLYRLRATKNDKLILNK